MAEGTDKPASSPKRSFAAPTGTRDLYPLELARRRWIEDKWRKTAVRHGFDEIDGPTFEHTELYTAKSGDGIVGEIFSTFSGKDPQAVQQMGARLAAGDRGAIAPYALRPEFTPTLARMFAARGGQFPKPCKWFWQGPCYRAEKPQRGRLREFWQWNVDILGLQGDPTSPESAQIYKRKADAEVLACIADLLLSLGLQPKDLKIRLNDRAALAALLTDNGVQPENLQSSFALLDRAGKMRVEDFHEQSAILGIRPELGIWFCGATEGKFNINVHSQATQALFSAWKNELLPLELEAQSLGVPVDLTQLDVQIVRGLAYYTGMVFEVIVDGERAVAGGGRYDNLIETFGGPPTPAVGFGMGDVVLSLVLQGKKDASGKPLMPSDEEIAADLGLRPDVFVISSGNPGCDEQVGPTLAKIRRRGAHARRSYKSTGKISKLIKEADDAGARYVLIIESLGYASLKNMDNPDEPQLPCSIDEAVRQIMAPRNNPLA